MTDAFALVKRNDAFGLDGFAGKAIRERGVGVEAGDRRVFPGSMKRLPAGDDPPLTAGVVAGDPTAVDNFIGMDALVEAGQALEHYAHLRPQAGEFFQ